MTKAIYQPKYWHYLTGDFLNRIHSRFRKAVKILIAVVLGALWIFLLNEITNPKELSIPDNSEPPFRKYSTANPFC